MTQIGSTARPLGSGSTSPGEYARSHSTATTVVGASNELPEGAELEALFDRFLVRYWISPLVDQASVRRLLTTTPPAAGATMTLAELEKIPVDSVVLIHDVGYLSFGSDRRLVDLVGLD